MICLTYVRILNEDHTALIGKIRVRALVMASLNAFYVELLTRDDRGKDGILEMERNKIFKNLYAEVIPDLLSNA